MKVSGEIASLPNPPSTPRAHNDINAIVESLSDLGVQIAPRINFSSPGKLPKSINDRCIDSLRFVYFKDKPKLIEIVECFKSDIRAKRLTDNLIQTLLARLDSCVKHIAASQLSFNKRLALITDHYPSVKASPHMQSGDKLYPDQTSKRKSGDGLRNSIKHRRASTIIGGSKSSSTTSLSSVLTGASSVAEQLSANSNDSSFLVQPRSFETVTAATSFSSDGTNEDLLPSPPDDYGFRPSQANEYAVYGSFSNNVVEKEDVEADSRHNDSFNTCENAGDIDIDRPGTVESTPDNQLKASLLNTLPNAKSNVKLDVQQHHLVRKLAAEPFYAGNTSGRSILQMKKNKTLAALLQSESIVEATVESPVDPAVEVLQTSTFKARMTFTNSKPDRLLHLEASPISKDKPNRLQRHFGAERFLQIDAVEPSKEVSKSLSTSREHLLSQWMKAMNSKQIFLGNTWRLFHFERTKRPRTNKDNCATFQLRFFATSGPGLERISLKDFIEWAIPFEPNLNQSFCKAFARLDLSLSRTDSTVTFLPSQVRIVDDIKADGYPEDKQFNDPLLTFHSYDQKHPGAVMNDGCALISPAAAAMICHGLHIAGIWPVTFQGRINGAKGMWTISGPYRTDETDIWIEITKSQLKVLPRVADQDDDTCDEDRWTFEFLKHSSRPKPSCLHIDFIPILEERGVPSHTLRQLVDHQLDHEFRVFHEFFNTPERLRRWLYKTFEPREARNRDYEKPFVGGLPADDLEKVINLLDAGFDPKMSSSLAYYLQKVLGFWTIDMLDKLKISMGKTTSVLGIADPIGCLKPGEVHMAFSSAFVDEESGESCTHLLGEALVARHPSIRRSDIQKVTSVYKPELAHLHDVLVFPSVGCTPLASKLQGGDYDGDTFWLCWDPRMRGFMNAPTPIQSPNPSDFGIAVDTRTLGEVLGPGGDDVENWMSQILNFRLSDDMLGQVTNHHKNLAYKRESVSTPEVLLIADVHDIIIDAAKNGYTFSRDNFNALLAEHKLDQSLPKPAYLQLIDNAKKDTREAKERIDDLKTKYKKTSILDAIIFEIVYPQTQDFLENVRINFKNTACQDEDLEMPWAETKQFVTSLKGSDNGDYPVLENVLKTLGKDVQAVLDLWSAYFNPNNSSHTGAEYNALIGKFHERLHAIKPCNEDHPCVKQWTQKDHPSTYSRWEVIRASVAFHLCQRRQRPGYSPNTNRVFLMAGRELCFIKAQTQPGMRVVSRTMYNVYRPGKADRTAGARSGAVSEQLREEDTQEANEYDDDDFEYFSAED